MAETALPVPVSKRSQSFSYVAKQETGDYFDTKEFNNKETKATKRWKSSLLCRNVYYLWNFLFGIGRVRMATVSFFRNLVISTEEEAQRMLDAIEEAETRGPLECYDFSEEFKLGEEIIERGRNK